MVAVFLIFEGIGATNSKTLSILPGSLLVISPFFAIIALIKIQLSNGRLKGTDWAGKTLLLSSVTLFFAASIGPNHLVSQIARSTVCRTNIKGLSVAIAVYANEFNDQLPTPDKWCDLLITKTDISPKSFICRSRDDIEGESSYALNKHIAQMKLSQIPSDVVLLFETTAGKSNSERDYSLKDRTFVKEMPREFRYKGSEMVHKDRFNQAAGPETLAFKSHQVNSDRGCNVVLAGGSSHFMEIEDLPELRWDVENKVKFPTHLYEISPVLAIYPRRPILLLIFIAFGIASCLCAFYILKKFHFSKYLKFAVVLAIPSAFAGYLFGELGEAMCYFDRTVGGTGSAAGAFFGILTALCYASILADTRHLIKEKRLFNSYATYTGIAAGMICSTLTHTAIIIANYPTQLIGLVSGQIFGIITGAILGAICGRCLGRSFYNKLEQSTITDELESPQTGGD